MTEPANPFRERGNEWELYVPLVGSTMLELGNKRSGNATYKAAFEARGFTHVSVDWNGEDGALKRDLRAPLDLGTFDMVTNIGTTEHVDRQLGVWQNILAALHNGSVLVSITPVPGTWPRHGLWYPQLDFYRVLAMQNGLEVERLYSDHRHLNYARLVRVCDAPADVPCHLIERQ